MVVTDVCETPLALIASCLTVMFVCNQVIRLLVVYLNSCKALAPPSTTIQSGITEGAVMLTLSMQTGLIDIKMPQRMGAMSVVLFIVVASLFQTLLEITHPVLLSLSAYSKNVFSHLKMLLLCVILFTVPCYMSYLMIQTIDLDLWTMVVVSSSLLTSIQVIGKFTD